MAGVNADVIPGWLRAEARRTHLQEAQPLWVMTNGPFIQGLVDGSKHLTRQACKAHVVVGIKSTSHAAVCMTVLDNLISKRALDLHANVFVGSHCHQQEGTVPCLIDRVIMSNVLLIFKMATQIAKIDQLQPSSRLFCDLLHPILSRLMAVKLFSCRCDEAELNEVCL